MTRWLSVTVRFGAAWYHLTVQDCNFRPRCKVGYYDTFTWAPTLQDIRRSSAKHSSTVIFAPREPEMGYCRNQLTQRTSVGKKASILVVPVADTVLYELFFIIYHRNGSFAEQVFLYTGFSAAIPGPLKCRVLLVFDIYYLVLGDVYKINWMACSCRISVEIELRLITNNS